MSLFPIFLKLAGRPCLVVGAGTVGEAKIAQLREAAAVIRVVAPRGTGTVERWAQAGEISWVRRRFEPADLDGVFLVVVATQSRGLNEGIFREAQRRNVLCNVVDDPPRCDFYFPSIVRRGELHVAISTAGHSPADVASHRTPAPWYTIKAQPSTADILAKLRRPSSPRNIGASRLTRSEWWDRDSNSRRKPRPSQRHAR